MYVDKKAVRAALDVIVAQAHDPATPEAQGEAILQAVHTIRSNFMYAELPSPNILADLERLLTSLGIRGVLIGGMAANFYGGARGTEDVDYLVDALPSIEVLRDRDYMARFNFYPKKSGSYTGTVLNLEHKHGAVDLLLAQDVIDAVALDTAIDAYVLGVRVNIVSVTSFVAMKARARRPKDIADIIAVAHLLSNDELASAVGDLGLLAAVKTTLGH